MRLGVPFLFIAGVMTACGSDARTPATDPPSPPAAAGAPAAGPSEDRVIFGTVVYEPEATFRPCDGGPVVAFLDSTDNRLRATVGLSGSNESQGVTIIGVGATAASRELIIREVRYAVAPAAGEGCSQPAPVYAMGLRGIDSAWTITIRPEGIEYRNAAGTDNAQFAGAPQSGDGSISTRTLGSPERTLQISLTPGSCRDPKNGAWAPFRATVTLDGRTLSGCAWRGT